MHELALSESILELLLEQSRAAQLSRITRVVLEIGALAGVEPEALRFCFDAVTRNSPAEGAALHIEWREATGTCAQCGQTFPLAGFMTPCPDCGAYGVTPTAGLELRVSEFEGL